MSTTEGFVGRTRELEEFDAAFAAARSGAGSLIVVSGEAGIGKTRLCDEVAARARACGLTVASARCWVDGGAPPLWPWGPILAELGGGAALASAGFPDAMSGLPTDGERDRFGRFVAVTDRLAEACARAPACVIVDDVHAADAGTLLLVRFVARSLARLPLVLVLGRRTGDDPGAPRPGASLLEEIEAEAVPVVLGRFDLDETRELLAAHGFDPLDADLVPALHRITGGNPLFLRRVVAAGPSREGETPPSGLPMAIDRALAGLSDATRSILQAASVLGLGPSVAEAAAVAQCEPVAVLDALVEAESLAVPDGPTRFVFSHELVRSALEASMRPADRLDAHARAAAAIAGDGPATRTDALARRAHHALAAAPRSRDDARLAVEACRRAACAMVVSFAYETADDLLSAAVGLHRGAAPGPAPGGLLVEWARAALLCGRMTDARERFDRAASAVESEGDPVLLAEVALGLGGHWVNEYRSPVERARVLGLQRRALDGLPAEHAALRCRLEVRLAAEAVFDGAPVEPVLDAVDRARHTGDPAALAEALSLAHHVLLRPDRADGRLAMADELVRVASEAGHGVLALMGLCWRAVDLFVAGDDRALPALEDLRERATALACQNILYMVGVMDVMLLIRAGRFADAEAESERCRRLGEQIGEVDTLGYHAAHLLGVRWIQGREAELLDLAAEVATSPTLARDQFAFRAAAAAFLARAGRRDEARAALDQLTAGGLAALPQSTTWLVGMTAVVELAATLGDAAVAGEAYDLLLPYAGVPSVGGLAVLCLGSTQRALGLAASAAGDTGRAVGHLEEAVAANHRLGNRPLVAVARADLARAVAATGDRERAAHLLRAAVVDADGLGMAERAAAWRDEVAALDMVDDRDRSDDRGAAGRGTIRREGAGWLVALGDRRALVGDRVGMRYLAELLVRPGQVVSSLTLASQGQVPDDAAAHELLDDRAREHYAARARELVDDVARAEADHDLARAERLRDELDALVDQLGSAVGLGGRARSFADPTERARSAVGKAIRRALDAIDRADPVLAELLRATVTTGTACAYTPDPRRPIAWSSADPGRGRRGRPGRPGRPGREASRTPGRGGRDARPCASCAPVEAERVGRDGGSAARLIPRRRRPR